MRFSKLVAMAWRQTVSDLRHIEWRSLLSAIALATTLATFLALLGNQLEKGLGKQTADILGADLTLSGSRPITDSIRAMAEQQQLQQTEVIQFSSMLSVNQQMLLSSVRAITSPYPLRGSIVTDIDKKQDIPAPGTAWAEPQLLERLGAKIGSQVQLGYSRFTISATMLSSPDRGNGFRSFSPQLLINRADLAATQVIQPGSRIGYRMLFSGSESRIKDFERWLQNHLEPQQRVWSVYTDQPMAPGAQQNASVFLKLAALFGLLLCGLIISLSLQRYSLSQFQRCALLISLGMSRSKLLWLYFTQLCIGWSLAVLPGTLLSIALVRLVAYMLQTILPTGLPPADPQYYASGALLSFSLLLVIGFVPLIRMSRVPVMGLLRQEALNPGSLSWAGRSLLAVGIWTVLAVYLNSGVSALLAIVLSAAITLLAGVIASTALAPMAKATAHRFRLGRLLRYRLLQQRKWHRMQLGVMGLLLALLSTLLLSRGELVERWQEQLPGDAPDQFLINIQPWELQPLGNFLQLSDIEHQLYPMIRGRIIGINGQQPEQRLSAEQLQHNSLHRELNLSWSAVAPDHNQVIAGQWWTKDRQQTAEPLISIEQELAASLELELGDQLSFDLAGQEITAEISNIRAVEWRSFKPNFYIIFSPGALQQFPQTYITSFRQPDNREGFSRQLVQQFPALTLIDVRQIIAQAERLIRQLIQASGVIMLLTLLAGLFLIQLLLHQELEQRNHENSVLRTLGATSTQTRRLDLLEFSLLGLLSGLMAAFISELLIGFISYRLLGLPLILHPSMWLALPATGILIFISSTLLRRTNSRF